MSSSAPKRKRLMSLFIVGLFIYAIIILVPISVGRAVRPGSSISNEHTWASKSYRLEVERGETYTFSLSFSDFWGMDMAIALYSSPLKVAGIKWDLASATSEQITFTAEHSGYYYATVSGGGSGFFDVSFIKTTGIMNHSTQYVNFLKVGLLLLPAVLLYLINRGINKISTRRKGWRNRPPASPMSTQAYSAPSPQTYQRVNQVCEYCGIEFTGYRENCPNCGAYLKSNT